MYIDTMEYIENSGILPILRSRFLDADNKKRRLPVLIYPGYSLIEIMHIINLDAYIKRDESSYVTDILNHLNVGCGTYLFLYNDDKKPTKIYVIRKL